jgi:pimeloyl-ACP methyl ester carboxylesterase
VQPFLLLALRARRYDGFVESVTSNDGTRIAFHRSGSGPPLVLVHGTTADHTRWTSILPALERRFTVYAMDRRGRGKSGDAEPYILEREFEDVAAVVDAARPKGARRGVALLGHSYGGLCALEAALRTPLDKLILYEPAFPIEGIELYPRGMKERLQGFLDRGDRDGLLVAFFRDVAGVPESHLALMRAEPVWKARLASAHTVVRELADADYTFKPERFRHLEVPTLLLVGGDSPPSLTKPTERLAAALPNSRIAVMPGQGHVAMSTAPDLFLREVLGFLES